MSTFWIKKKHQIIRSGLLLALVLLLYACGAGVQTQVQAVETEAVTTPVPIVTAPPVSEIIFPDGTVHKLPERRVDLSNLSHEEVADTAEVLKQMLKLRYVNLGEEDVAALKKDSGKEPEGDGRLERKLTWEDIRLLQDACPDTDFEYHFTLFGKQFCTLDTEMDFHHVTMDDEGAAVREVLPCMTKCELLDMDFSGVSSEKMAEIRDAYPQIKVVWRIWFGNDCSVRTDVERILASNLNHVLTDGNTKDLKYCTKVRFLDVGHNTALRDFSFLAYMPDLEVAVICITGLNDLTPLANHEKLEYLEINTCTKGLDLSPLGTCPNLEHICACFLGHVQGWEELKKLTKLQRLWFGRYTKLPEGGIDELQEALPNTIINTTNEFGSSGDWRYEGKHLHPRYALLREQFDYSNYTNVSSSWYNDPKYYKKGEQRYRPSW